MGDEKKKQAMEYTFNADYERERIRRIGEGMNSLAKHWSYLGGFRGGKSSTDFWEVKRSFKRLCGMRDKEDEPDFLGNMEGKSLQSLESSVDAAIDSLKHYEDRHNTFFGFLARLFSRVSYARMQDTEIALRRLQEMKNSLVRLRTHGEGLNGPSADQMDGKERAEENRMEAEAAEKTAEKTAERKMAKSAAKKKEAGEEPAASRKQPEEIIDRSQENVEKPTEPADDPDEELDDEPDQPEYDEQWELDFQKKTAMDRSPIKQKIGSAEFFKGYDEFVINHPDRMEEFNSNKIKDLKKLQQDLGKTDPDLNSYLERRMKNLKKIRKLEKQSEENFKQRQAYAPEIEKTAKTTKVILPDVTQPQLQHTLGGCWSVTLSSMLRQKGVEMDQETIRAFRPDSKICTPYDLRSMNGDMCNSIDLSRELIMNVLPDTALNSIQTDVVNLNMYDKKHPWAPWSEADRVQKHNEFKDKIRAVLERSLETDRGSLALLMKDHYQTVYGYEKVTADGKEEEYVYLHDPNNPQKTKMTLDELAEEGYKLQKDLVNEGNFVGEQYSFDAHWLQDLTNDKGELALDEALTKKGVTYEDHKLKCNNLTPAANHAYDNANWRTVKTAMDQDISVTTYLPVTVKNLAKKRILDPIRASELSHQEIRITGSGTRKTTMQKTQSGLSEEKKPDDLKPEVLKRK